MLAWYVIGAVMTVPMIIGLGYVITGFSKATIVTFITKIPADRMWILVVPIIICCMYTTVKCFTNALLINEQKE